MTLASDYLRQDEKSMNNYIVVSDGRCKVTVKRQLTRLKLN